jgi:hypothetical protein
MNASASYNAASAGAFNDFSAVSFTVIYLA